MSGRTVRVVVAVRIVPVAAPARRALEGHEIEPPGVERGHQRGDDQQHEGGGEQDDEEVEGPLQVPGIDTLPDGRLGNECHIRRIIPEILSHKLTQTPETNAFTRPRHPCPRLALNSGTASANPRFGAASAAVPMDAPPTY